MAADEHPSELDPSSTAARCGITEISTVSAGQSSYFNVIRLAKKIHCT
jgi:hypothetical protein